MKPDYLWAKCPYCSEKNRFSFMMLGDIIDRKVMCRGCAKRFGIRVKWQPIIESFKELEHA